ncbi:hypothetical protein ACQSSU_03185 [Micromonospora echinospora]
MSIASGDRIAPREVNAYLLTTPDAGFPVNANATGSEAVANRLTVPAAPYDRILIMMAHTYGQYSQAANRVTSRLYLNANRLDNHDQYLTVSGADFSFKHYAQALLDANVAGVVEVRFARLTGTGAVTTSTASTTTLTVQHRAA